MRVGNESCELGSEGIYLLHNREFIPGDDVWMRIIDVSLLDVVEVANERGKAKRCDNPSLYKAKKYSDEEFARLRKIIGKMRVVKLPWNRREFESLYLDASQLETFLRAVECSRERIIPAINSALLGES